jgi:hypothetical protein
MSYEQIKDLRPILFKRYCGVKPETFSKMVEVVSDHLSQMRVKTGRPPKLSVEDQVLMTLEYWREYRTFFHLAKSWGLHESSVWLCVRRPRLERKSTAGLQVEARYIPEQQTVEASESYSRTPCGRPKAV